MGRDNQPKARQLARKDKKETRRGIFANTRAALDAATQRAQALSAKFNAYTAPEPFTAVHELVARLTTSRD